MPKYVMEGGKKATHNGWMANQSAFVSQFFVVVVAAAEVGAARSSLFVEICSHQQAIRATRL
jgi:hypothetical protein